MSVEYRVGITRQVVNALRKTWDADYPDPLLQSIYVGTDFQFEKIKYPSIIVHYGGRTLRNIGLGHIEIGEQNIRHWYFEGTLTFSVLALTPFERDTLLDNLVEVIGMSRDRLNLPFWDEIYDDDFIVLNIINEDIQPGGDTNFPTPWGDENETLFGSQFTINSSGEFFNDIETGEMVRISHVHAYPYRPDQSIPVGVDDPAPWQ